MGAIPDSARIADVLADIDRIVPLAPGGEPVAATARGAVAHVVGIEGRSGERYMAKLFPAALAHRAQVEVEALDLVARNSSVPAPRVVHAGVVPGREGGARNADDGGRLSYVVMTRLEGIRWAERRFSMTVGQQRAVARQAGLVLRGIHRVRGPWFGDLLPHHGELEAASMLTRRSAAAADGFCRTGGDRGVARAALTQIDNGWPGGGGSTPPVLCHCDYNQGNIMLSTTEDPAVTGVFDWERACWDDPMRDLSRIALQLRQQDQGLVDAVIDGYGGLDAEQVRRLPLHELVHLLEERAWVALDRPAGWSESLIAVDGAIRSRLGG